MRVLIGCEESQRVTESFRNLGFEAYSNDIMDTSGNHQEWHLKMDLFEAVELIKPDCLIAFPPCTYLTVSANAHYVNNPERWEKRLDAMKFVHKIMNLPIKHIAIENPVGVISSHIRKPDQIIQPWYFGDPEIKKTCLWLKNLPLLQYALEDDIYNVKTAVEPDYVLYKSKKTKSGFTKYGKITGTNPSTNNPENAKLRSKTYAGIANAMALQWGEYILK
ncbi:hypothetical protein [Chryseobacterium bernardetii]|uniref:hypothetical protein n=1 Tax=Chryseobacterium bernardetii TaxID=1241978 RepID=UPI001627AF82|nr:hypothetical protein [Chryseobacterium bernardetii]